MEAQHGSCLPPSCSMRLRPFYGQFLPCLAFHTCRHLQGFTMLRCVQAAGRRAAPQGLLARWQHATSASGTPKLMKGAPWGHREQGGRRATRVWGAGLAAASHHAAPHPAPAATVEGYAEGVTSIVSKDNFAFVVDEPPKLGGKGIGGAAPLPQQQPQQPAAASPPATRLGAPSAHLRHCAALPGSEPPPALLPPQGPTRSPTCWAAWWAAPSTPPPWLPGRGTCPC